MAAINIAHINDINSAALEFLDLCKSRFFFAFYGDLGVGKTTFIKAICRQLGSKDNVSSPTFSLVNEYHIQAGSTGKSSTIYHMDFYRLKNVEEALDIGVDEYFKKENSYCFIEWPKLVESLLPEGTVKVQIEKKDNARIIKIESLKS